MTSDIDTFWKAIQSDVMINDIVTCGLCGDDTDEVAHLFVIAANHSADAVWTLAAGLRATADPAHWQRMEPDFTLPSLPAPGRQPRRRRRWSMH